jgi:hypothetical protein
VVRPDEPDSTHGDDGPNGAQIKTFLIADVRGYTLFRQERGDEDANALGEKVTVWVTDSDEFPVSNAVDVMHHVVEALNDIGLRAHLKIVHKGEEYAGAIYGQQQGPKSYRQAYLGAWGATYPGAGGFLDDDFRWGALGIAPILCTDTLDTWIEDALQLQATDPVSAYAVSTRTENVQVHLSGGS